MAQNENDEKKPYPLWMPSGSVRAIAFLGSVGAVITYTGYIVLKLLPPEKVTDVATAMVGGLLAFVGMAGQWYFNKNKT